MHVIYVSYDGALDPLGVSQVVPYLKGLAALGWSITLITFEKSERWQGATAVSVRAGLEAAGVRWRPLTYRRGRRPAMALLNVLAGTRAIRSEARRTPPAIVHCRGEVAAVMARWAALPAETRFLYDVRGHFSDERVDGGSWRRGGAIDRVVRAMEARNLRRADAVVVLTRRAAAELGRRRAALPLTSVIPTCADVSLFTPRAREEKPEFGLVYSGSLGTWYMAEEMIRFVMVAARDIPGPALFLTPQAEQARRLGLGPEWAEVRTVEPVDVPQWLRRATASFFFIRPVASKGASCPTKFAEALASGLPVVCNRGIGDLDDVVETEGVGVLVDEFSDTAYHEAASRLRELLRDSSLRGRCRRVAESAYSVDLGVREYHRVYQNLSGRAGALSR